MGVLRFVDAICRVIVGLGVLVMVGSITGQVFYRAVLGDYLGWAEEAARFSFVWLVFMGSVSAFSQRRHLGIDFLPEFLGSRGRVVLDTAICVFTLALMCVVARYSYELTVRTMTQVSPAMQVTMGYVYVAMPISAALISVYALVDVVRNVLALAAGDLSRAAIDTRSGLIEQHADESGA